MSSSGEIFGTGTVPKTEDWPWWGHHWELSVVFETSLEHWHQSVGFTHRLVMAWIGNVFQMRKQPASRPTVATEYVPLALAKPVSRILLSWMRQWWRCSNGSPVRIHRAGAYFLEKMEMGSPNVSYWILGVLGKVSPTAFHVFQRGRATTNQK
jgi:hypothetical protein